MLERVHKQSWFCIETNTTTNTCIIYTYKVNMYKKENPLQIYLFSSQSISTYIQPNKVHRKNKSFYFLIYTVFTDSWMIWFRCSMSMVLTSQVVGYNQKCLLIYNLNFTFFVWREMMMLCYLTWRSIIFKYTHKRPWPSFSM